MMTPNTNKRMHTTNAVGEPTSKKIKKSNCETNQPTPRSSRKAQCRLRKIIVKPLHPEAST